MAPKIMLFLQYGSISTLIISLGSAIISGPTRPLESHNVTLSLYPHIFYVIALSNAAFLCNKVLKVSWWW